MTPPYQVLVHKYLSPLSPSSSKPRYVAAYEHLLPSSSPPRNALIFIPGLGEGPHDIPYVPALAEQVAAQSYSVFEIRLASAYTAFGFGSLSDDVRDLKALVKYLKGLGRERVVLLGHSTGCQDCVAFGLSSDDEGVDGFVLQGPVSDREAVGLGIDGEEMRLFRDGVSTAEELVKVGKGDVVMDRDKLPGEWKASPITAYRWYSLVAVGGDDDFFSSDLPDEKLTEIWGKLRKPVLILPSAEDEHVPASVDVAALLERWKSFCRPGVASELSGLVPGANHRIDDEKAQKWFADRVVRFLAG